MKKIFFVTFFVFALSFAQAQEQSSDATTDATTSVSSGSETTNSASIEGETVILPVPQSRFSIQTLDNEFTPKKAIHIELTTSSWSPSHLSGESNLSNTTYFRKSSLPQLSLSGWSEGWDFSILNIAPKLGFSFAQYERKGQLLTNGSMVEQNQSMNLYSLFFGFELSPQKYLWGHLQAYLDIGLVPAWAQASAGTFNQDGVSNVYWATKEALGLSWRFEKIKDTPTADVALAFGVEKTQGLGKKDLSATGITSGLRLGL